MDKVKKESLLEWLSNYDSLIVFGGFGCAVLLVIILTGMFQAGPSVRSNLLFNAMGTILMGIGFIFIIFKFMGSQVIVFGRSFDVGMFIYMAIVLFVMFVLGE